MNVATLICGLFELFTLIFKIINFCSNLIIFFGFSTSIFNIFSVKDRHRFLVSYSNSFSSEWQTKALQILYNLVNENGIDLIRIVTIISCSYQLRNCMYELKHQIGHHCYKQIQNNSNVQLQS